MFGYQAISNRQLDQLKTGDGLREYVIDYIKEGYDPEERETFIQDVLWSGCQSGIVSDLILYRDTHTFFDRFYGEIEELRQLHEITSMPLAIKGDLKNYLAWFGFEQTVSRLAEELGLEC